MSLRRMLCKLFGHRWDKDDMPYPEGKMRGCRRCYLIHYVEHVPYDGFRWKVLG